MRRWSDKLDGGIRVREPAAARENKGEKSEEEEEEEEEVEGEYA